MFSVELQICICFYKSSLVTFPANSFGNLPQFKKNHAVRKVLHMLLVLYISKMNTTLFHSHCVKSVQIRSFSCNLEQKVGDKFTKLIKIGFSIEYFTADFSQFFPEKCQNSTFGWTAVYSPSNPSITVISLKLPNFLRS